MKAIDSIRESFKTKQVKYGGYAALITLAVIIGLIFLNLMAEQLSPQVDLTYSGIFSLSGETIQVLENVKTPVKFYGLWRPGEEDTNVADVINLYLSRNRNITFELVDPDRNPGFVMRYDRERRGIARGSLIVEGEKGYRVIAPTDMYDFSQNQQGGSYVTGVSVERRITSALLFAGTGEIPVIYELAGHSEIPLAAYGITDVMERENYSMGSVNLLLYDVPQDASVLVFNSPTRDITSDEADKLLDYLDKGGRLLVMTDYSIQDLTNLNLVLASYGIEFNYGIVIETDPYYVAIDQRTEWPDLADHEITRPLMDKSRTPVVLLEAMALSQLETKRRSVEITPLMTTSSSAFHRTDLYESSPTKVASDIPGPLMIGAAIMDPSWIQGEEPQARIVVIGGGTLLSLAIQGFEANLDLFMNSLTWLQDRPENITVRSKSLYLLPLRMNLAQVIIYGALFIFVFPMAFFITGFVTWLRRRHL
ncbi:MAG: GldG family protein [Treponema sp.]|nr:GldG family protein [Treponema sp.]